MSTEQNKQLVVTATTQLFVERDVTALDRYFGPTYIQHSPAPDGLQSLRDLAGALPDDFTYHPARALADGDLVVLHGTYVGFGPEPLVAFDVFRVADGRIVEHWDALTPVVAETASGRSQTDGPTEVTDPAATEASRALVSDFAERVLVGADYDALTDFISTQSYAQHNPEAADGLAGFGAAAAAWGAQGKALAYAKVHQVVADGEFVFVRSEGEFGVPVAYNDLFRVQDGRIVEHWDVVAPLPAELPHGNGSF